MTHVTWLSQNGNAIQIFIQYGQFHFVYGCPTWDPSRDLFRSLYWAPTKRFLQTVSSAAAPLVHEIQKHKCQQLPCVGLPCAVTQGHTLAPPELYQFLNTKRPCAFHFFLPNIFMPFCPPDLKSDSCCCSMANTCFVLSSRPSSKTSRWRWLSRAKKKLSLRNSRAAPFSSLQRYPRKKRLWEIEGEFEKPASYIFWKNIKATLAQTKKSSSMTPEFDKGARIAYVCRTSKNQWGRTSLKDGIKSSM